MDKWNSDASRQVLVDAGLMFEQTVPGRLELYQNFFSCNSIRAVVNVTMAAIDFVIEAIPVSNVNILREIQLALSRECRTKGEK
jgi:hypothetical protein